MDNENEKRFKAGPTRMNQIVRESKENADAIAEGLYEEIERLIELAGVSCSVVGLVVPYDDENGVRRLVSVSNIRTEHQKYVDDMLEQLAESRDPQHNLELPTPDGPEFWPEDIEP